MTDTRNFIEKTISRYRNVTGNDPSAQDLAREFAKLSPSDRVENLEMLAAEDEPRTVEEAAQYLQYEQAIRATHENLRKADR